MLLILLSNDTGGKGREGVKEEEEQKQERKKNSRRKGAKEGGDRKKGEKINNLVEFTFPNIKTYQKIKAV